MARFWVVVGRIETGLELLRDPLMLMIRWYWGWSLMWNGWGKLHNLDKIAQWFGNDLGIPFPYANAVAAGTTEFLGSLLILLGLASRPAAAAVFFTMSVAYATSDRAAVATLGTDFFCANGTNAGDCFTLAAPFPYWFMALLVLVIGPGKLSLDELARRYFAPAPARAADRAPAAL